MTPRDDDKLLDHDYDGIRELDNPVPFWLNVILWGTVIFSAWYLLYYQFGHGETIKQQYDREMLALYDMQSKALLKLGPITDKTIADMQSNAGMMASATSLFAARCSPCHGAHAQGNIGPNLTDDYWLHGGRPTQIYHTISEGVPAKGMISWKNQLSAGEMLALAAYVMTLHDSRPAGPKAPQGDLVSPADVNKAIEEGLPYAPPGQTPSPPAAPR
jgi:cytochrome c oxidase cbb3-type subunit 3